MQTQVRQKINIGLGVMAVLIAITALIFWGLKNIDKSASSDSKSSLLSNAETSKPAPIKLDLPVSVSQNQPAQTYTATQNPDKSTDITLASQDLFKLNLPQNLNQPVSVLLTDNKTISISQQGENNLQAIEKTQIKTTPENAKLLAIIQTDPSLKIYQNENQTTFYTAQESKNENQQWLLKNWTIYNAPPASRGAEAQPPLGGLASSDEITQTFKLKNATINLDSAGDANVFYGDAQAKNQEAAFIIPRPYLLDKDGNKTDLNWKFEKETSLLSVSFSMPKTSFPLALDPSILKTDKAIATFSGKTLTMSAACGASLVCGSNCLYNGVLYGTVLIGSQCWMNENLRTDKYPDGTSITRGPVGATWNGNDNGYYAYPPNTANNAEETLANIQTNKLGFVYQWSAAMKGSTTEGAQGICPAGWHVPTDAQQYVLENYLKTGATCDANRNNAWDCDGAGTKLKIGGSSGFNAPLAGFRSTTGVFGDRATYAYLWSSSPASSSTAWARDLNSANSTVGRYTYSKAYGFSVRCLKN